MDIMSGIAAASMDWSAAKLSQSVSVSVQKKVMETQELAVQEIEDMLPSQPETIDVYA